MEIIDENDTVVEPDNMGNNDSFVGKITNITENGIQNIEINNKTYTVNVINHNGNLELDGEKEVEGAILSNKTYEFGNQATDVATTATTEAQNMVILKVNGDLIIDEGVTLTSCKSDEGYGGPKGMMIYCKGTITNNGTISMTARGAKAKGEDVYLWQNEDGSYEYVPATGGAGAAGVSASGTTWNSGGWYEGHAVGKDAPNATGRALGGGGSGSVRVSNQYTVKSASGSSATSYSGGSGSGGTFSAKSNVTGYAGIENGGKGGNGYVYENGGYTSYGGGGAGNPGGFGYSSSNAVNQTRTTAYDGENGTRWTFNNIC